MREYRTWHEILMEQLADPAAAIDYLRVTWEEYQIDEDTPFFLREIWAVIEAQGGISKLAKKTGIEPKILKEVLSGEETPRIDIFNVILRGLGCQISIQPLKGINSSNKHIVEDAVVSPQRNDKVKLERTTESRGLR